VSRPPTYGGLTAASEQAWDLVRRDELARLLFDAVRSAPREVVLNLSGTTVVDGESVSTILQCAARLRARGGGLVVVVSSPPALRILDAAGLTGDVPVFETVAAACSGTVPAPGGDLV
jgi:anti-anti-sigma factor